MRIAETYSKQSDAQLTTATELYWVLMPCSDMHFLEIQKATRRRLSRSHNSPCILRSNERNIFLFAGTNAFTILMHLFYAAPLRNSDCTGYLPALGLGIYLH
jgi:hypothetical protein